MSETCLHRSRRSRAWAPLSRGRASLSRAAPSRRRCRVLGWRWVLAQTPGIASVPLSSLPHLASPLSFPSVSLSPILPFPTPPSSPPSRSFLSSALPASSPPYLPLLFPPLSVLPFFPRVGGAPSVTLDDPSWVPFLGSGLCISGRTLSPRRHRVVLFTVTSCDAHKTPLDNRRSQGQQHDPARLGGKQASERAVTYSRSHSPEPGPLPLKLWIKPF